MLYPSPFEVGDQFEFKNKHGNVVLEAVALPQAVRNVRLEDAPKECIISWDTAAQIALITDQVRLSPCLIGEGLKMDENVAAYIRYATTNTAGWVKVVSLNYTTATRACEMIESDLNNGRNSLRIQEELWVAGHPSSLPTG